MTPLLGALLLTFGGATGVSARPVAKGLPREEAAARAARLADVKYTLGFVLDADSATIPGRAFIHFRLQGSSEPLTLDYAVGELESLAINGTSVPSPAYNGFFITLPPELLREGANIVAAFFRSRYSQDGSGLYRARDPEDGRSYVNSDFEPYDANRLFPCFDQPDLKATYQLDVDAPLDWTVISAARESEVLPGARGRRHWFFPETKPFSTYLFSLHAGPWAEWSSSVDGIPLRLFARRSLAEQVPVREWFELTAAGLRFYNEYFGVRYPFEKYDQLLVPDFESGAMENVAAATFSERFLTRGAATRQQRLDRASTILHEMAHMWFGDLVTMRWWDDLWLNESFATYMAALAVSEATEFKGDAWIGFHGEKHWAYQEDQQAGTHPIESPAPDTEQAFANFDGITYGKGASALQQAAYALGARAFRDGVRRYLSENAFGNAERRHFMKALERAAARPLERWTRDWLQTAGLNAVEPVWECRDGRLSSFELLQSTVSGAPLLRAHRTRILFFDEREGALSPAGAPLDAGYDGGRTAVAAARGRPCPAFVLPNAGDHDYVKLRFDAASLAAIRRGLMPADELDRAVLWGELWEMARDARLPEPDYAALAIGQLPRETNFAIAQRIVRTLAETRFGWGGSALGFIAGDAQPLRRLAAAQAGRFEAVFSELLAGAEAGGDWQRLWFDAFVGVAESAPALARLRGWLAGENLPRGLELDQDRRWRLLWQLARRNDPSAEKGLAAERRRDGSRRGQTEAVAVDAARPDPAVKRRWFERLLADDALVFEDQRAAIESLFPPEQQGLRWQFAEGFYARLPALAEKRSSSFIGVFAPNLAPLACDGSGVAELEGFLASSPRLPAIALKALSQARDEDRLCARVRSLAVTSAGGP